MASSSHGDRTSMPYVPSSSPPGPEKPVIQVGQVLVTDETRLPASSIRRATDAASIEGEAP